MKNYVMGQDIDINKLFGKSVLKYTTKYLLQVLEYCIKSFINGTWISFSYVWIKNEYLNF